MMEIPQDGEILAATILLNAKEGGYNCTLRGGPEQLKEVRVPGESRAKAAQNWCQIVRDYVERENSKETKASKRDTSTTNAKKETSIHHPKENLEEPPSLQEAAYARRDYLSERIGELKQEIMDTADKLDYLHDRLADYEVEVSAIGRIIKETEMGRKAQREIPFEDSSDVPPNCS